MIFDFLSNYENSKIFWDKLKNIGAFLETSYITTGYKGPPIITQYQLYLKEGFLHKKILILSKNEQNLKSIKSSINNFPSCKEWDLIIRKKSQKIKSGNYIIKEITKFIGTAGVEKEITKIVKELGGDENNINYILNRCEEKTLGYFPWNDPEIAQKYVDIIYTGATIPVSGEEFLSALESFKKNSEYGAEMGDKKSESLAKTFGELSNMWKEKLKNEGDATFEQKLIQKYMGSVGEKYVLELLKEYTEQDVIFTPLRKKVSENDINNLYLAVDNSESLIPKQKIEAIIAIMSIFGGSYPNEKFLPHLEKIFGSEFIATIKEKVGNSKTSISKK